MSSQYEEMFWLRVGGVSLEHVRDARVTLHWTLQLAEAVAQTLLEPADDSSHTSLTWDVEHGGFVGQALAQGHRVHVDIRWFRIGVRKLDGSKVAELELDGKTLAEALTWLQTTLQDAGYSFAQDLALPTHDLPAHPAKDGAPLSMPDGKVLFEVARYYHNASAILGLLSEKHPLAQPLRAWPHHFDIATLIQVDSERSLNVGLSPGDATFDEPYFYVVPHPAPAKDATLPDFDGHGAWHQGDWTGCVLKASDLIPLTQGKSQHIRVVNFVNLALDAAEKVLPS